VLYVHADTDRFSEFLESFRTWASGIDQIYSASAAQTGGERHVRFVTEAVAGECRAIVTKVAVSAAALGNFGATNRELGAQGFNRRDRKYVIFADANVYCGIGGFAGDSKPTADNRSNFGPSYGRTDSGCWGAGTASHELGHNLGAVNNNAPNTSGGGHCVDEYDVMCYSDSPNFPEMQFKCADRANNARLDCNHDDYYSTAPPAGSYLATHWNVADSVFLVQGGGGGPTPDTTPPTAPTGLAAADVTATSLTLSWTAATDDIGVSSYEVRRDGVAVGTASVPSFTVTGLTAETAYSFTVLARDAAGNTSAPSAALSVTTAAGGGGGTGPQVGVPTVLANGLTGRVADVYRGSTAAGTPVIQYPAHGGANQQWVFTDTGGGTYAIRSVGTGLCLDARDPRGRISQQGCDAAAASQRWTATASGSGFRLSPASAPTQVLGLSSTTIDGARILGLRTPSAQVARSTVWTLTAA
jgi:chitodextrinase